MHHTDMRTSTWKAYDDGHPPGCVPSNGASALDPLKHFPNEAELDVRHPSHAKLGIHTFPDQLFVLTMIENPLRFRKRYENYYKFEDHMKKGGAILYTAEVAFGERRFEITDAKNPRHLQLRAYGEFWRKENVLNLLAARLPPEAKYIGTFDADIQFARSDWAQEILHQLQHYDVLQPFSHAQDLGPDDEPLANEHARSFIRNYVEHGFAPHSEEFMEEIAVRWTTSGVIQPKRGEHPTGSPYGHLGVDWHPGLAWCYRKTAWDTMGGLMDWLPTGSGDWHMANAFIGNLMRSIDPAHTDSYKRQCQIWQDRVVPAIRDNPNGGLGYMPGLLMHSFHGSKAARQYSFRHKFVLNVEYDPDLDIKRDHQGLWQLTDRNPRLRDGLRIYGRARNEDSR